MAGAPRADRELADAGVLIEPSAGGLRAEALVEVLVAGQDDLRAVVVEAAAPKQPK